MTKCVPRVANKGGENYTVVKCKKPRPKKRRAHGSSKPSKPKRYASLNQNRTRQWRPPKKEEDPAATARRKDKRAEESVRYGGPTI